MYSSHSRILLALAIAWTTVAVAAASPLGPPHDKTGQAQSLGTSRADPCWTGLGKGVLPSQPRTEESDASFRKSAPPRGSVKLSAAALKFVKLFLRQIRSKALRDDQIASISWARDRRWKGPNDAACIDQGAGWVLGAYSRTQLPPDVIDKVGGIEIVFGAEDPLSLAGKTVDIKDRKLFVRD
jgi:hypothetical protein